MKGYNGLGEIAERFKLQDGVMVDKQFGLSKEQLNKFEVKPHLTKTNIEMMSNPKVAEKVLNGFQKDGNEAGTYQPYVGFGRKNGNKLTVGQILNIAERGGTNFGIYGYTYQELREATKSGVISKDALFDETTQTQMVFELIRQRSNRTNSIRGAIIQAKKGGKQTIFEGDEDIERWDRLINISPTELDVILDIFPLLRDTPANQFQNLTGGVVLEIEKIYKKETKKQAEEKKVSDKSEFQVNYLAKQLGISKEKARNILTKKLERQKGTVFETND